MTKPESRLNESGKIAEWVNAVIEIRIPMNLPHHATKTEKLDEAEQLFEELEIPTDFVADIHWEDAGDEA